MIIWGNPSRLAGTGYLYGSCLKFWLHVKIIPSRLGGMFFTIEISVLQIRNTVSRDDFFSMKLHHSGKEGQNGCLCACVKLVNKILHVPSWNEELFCMNKLFCQTYVYYFKKVPIFEFYPGLENFVITPQWKNKRDIFYHNRAG